MSINERVKVLEAELKDLNAIRQNHINFEQTIVLKEMVDYLRKTYEITLTDKDLFSHGLHGIAWNIANNRAGKIVV